MYEAQPKQCQYGGQYEKSSYTTDVIKSTIASGIPYRDDDKVNNYKH